MGVMNLSVSQGPFDEEGSKYGFLVYERDDQGGPRDIRIVWSTEYGSERQAYWNISVAFTGIPKGAPYDSGTRYYSARLAASQCNETRPYGSNGRVWWSHSLDIGNLLDDVLGSSKEWMYSSRNYDTMTFDVSVYSEFVPGFEYAGQTTSDVARLAFNIGYCPEYRLVAAYYEKSDLMVIEYDTTWTRIDDRFWLQHNGQSGYCAIGSTPLLVESVTGSVPAKGRIEVPTSALIQHVVGEEIFINVFFNSVYRPVGMLFNNAEGYLTVENRYSCSTPTLSALSGGDTIRIKTGDSGDNANRCEFVTVKMVGGVYGCDQVTVPVGEVAEFRFAPFGKAATFVGIGSTSQGAVSEPSRAVSADSPDSDSIVIDSISGTSRVRINMVRSGDNKGPSLTVSPAVEQMKLAGRRRASAFYGTGGETTVDFSGVLLDDDGSEIEKMAEEGDVMVRFPGGRRYAITPSVNIDVRDDRTVFVGISGQEVSA